MKKGLLLCLMALGVVATAQVNRVGSRLPQGFKKANAVATVKKQRSRGNDRRAIKRRRKGDIGKKIGACICA